ncbi:hypothetical protein MRB53_013907 [Persea americana]|uniref:Uncharacterized protein n=1 Tax=Persea americana TaxID=3435 RepID=A0ACC2K9P2_PERAE|nr:hypothetical protein MRB53_013907 [Persea americana]
MSFACCSCCERRRAGVASAAGTTCASCVRRILTLDQPYVFCEQIWVPDFDQTRAFIAQISVWVMLPGLPLEYWEEKHLRTILEPMGLLLHSDEVTRSKGRAGKRAMFARALIEFKLEKVPIAGVCIHTLEDERFQKLTIENPPPRCNSSISREGAETTRHKYRGDQHHIGSTSGFSGLSDTQVRKRIPCLVQTGTVWTKQGILSPQVKPTKVSCNKSDLLEVDANDYTQAPPSEGDQVSTNTDFQSGLGYKIVPLPPVTSSPPCRGTFYVNAQLPIIADATNPCSNISPMHTSGSTETQCTTVHSSGSDGHLHQSPETSNYLAVSISTSVMANWQGVSLEFGILYTGPSLQPLKVATWPWGCILYICFGHTTRYFGYHSHSHCPFPIPSHHLLHRTSAIPLRNFRTIRSSGSAKDTGEYHRRNN